MRVGAIDCGTNSIRLLISDVEPAPDGSGTAGSAGARPAPREVVREMRIVRLGAGVDATGWLSQEALDRTFAAAREYAELLREHGVPPERVRMVATSATRDAGNRTAFVRGIEQILGVTPEVITGAKEAELSFQGAVAALPEEEPGRDLVVDVGGGSTEFVLGDRDGVIASRSVNIGCVRLTERHLSSNPPTEGQVRRVLADVDHAVTTALSEVPLNTATRLIGVAGSVTTVTAQALALSSYNPAAIHGARLPLEEVRRAAEQLTGMTRAQRAELGFMHEGRVDVIGAGAQIWARIIERVHELTEGRIAETLTSEQDILDGLALSIAAPNPGS